MGLPSFWVMPVPMALLVKAGMGRDIRIIIVVILVMMKLEQGYIYGFLIYFVSSCGSLFGMASSTLVLQLHHGLSEACNISEISIVVDIIAILCSKQLLNSDAYGEDINAIVVDKMIQLKN